MKTRKGKRTIPLAPQTIEALKKHREKMVAEGHGSQLVFCDTKGGFLRKSNVRRRSFMPMIERAKVPNFGLHGLRHTCATLLLQADVNIKVVSERLGHSTVVMTLTKYVHVMPGMQAIATEQIAGILT